LLCFHIDPTVRWRCSHGGSRVRSPCFSCHLTSVWMCSCCALAVLWPHSHCSPRPLWTCSHAPSPPRQCPRSDLATPGPRCTVSVLSLSFGCALAVGWMCSRCGLDVLSLTFGDALAVLALYSRCDFPVHPVCSHCASATIRQCAHSGLAVLLRRPRCAFAVRSLSMTRSHACAQGIGRAHTVPSRCADCALAARSLYSGCALGVPSRCFGGALAVDWMCSRCRLDVLSLCLAHALASLDLRSLRFEFAVLLDVLSLPMCEVSSSCNRDQRQLDLPEWFCPTSCDHPSS